MNVVSRCHDISQPGNRRSRSRNEAEKTWMVGISAVAVHFVHHFRDNFVYRASFFRDFDLFDFVLLMFLCFNNNRLIVDLVFFCTKIMHK